ncbi:MAG: Hint domain-containing protein [Pseudomonadota bacterium]
MATVTLLLRGDQIGRYTSFSGSGNGPDRVVTVEGVEAVGAASDEYTVIVEQVNAGATEFQNGQFVTILDPSGSVLVPRTGVQPDIEQGLGAGDEHLLLNNQPFLIDLAGLPAGPETVTYTQTDEVAGPGGDDDGELDFADFPCFAPGTMIGTPRGPIDVADLRVGDLVQTADHGSAPIVWIGRRVVDLADRGPGKPVLLKAGCLGRMQPSADLVISPDHRVLVRDAACDLLFGTREVLAPAKGLVALPRVRALHGRRRIEYVTVLTDRHEVIFANDMPVETLYPGPQALRRLGAFARSAILSVCPSLRGADLSVAYPAARRLISVKEAEALTVILRLKRRFSPETAVQETTTKLRVVR